MGCIYNRGSRSKPNYWIKWVGRDGQPKYKKIGADRELAKAVLAKVEHEVIAKRFDVQTEPPPPVPRLDVAADAWVAMRSAIGADGQPMFRAWRDDRTRLKLHLRPHFGRRCLDEITVDDVRALIEQLRRALQPQTIRNVLHTLSRLYEDQPKAMRLVNPVGQLDRNDRKKIGKGWDPRSTPFLKTKAEVRRLYLGFPEMARSQPFRPLFAVGALAGLRPGETRALEWPDIDNNTGLIHVQRSAEGPLKDGESRHVPMPAALIESLREWRAHCPAGSALVFPPIGRSGRHLDEDTINDALRAALGAADLPKTLTTYQCGRHTFGAQWVINGGSLHKLGAVLGHTSTEVTLRYAHLVPGEYTEAERALTDLDLRSGKVLPMRKRR